MAFLLEDGTGITDANAYISVAEFKAHHTDRNVAAVIEVDFSDAEISAAIIDATDYIDKRFGKWFRGYRKHRDQGTEFPRIDAYDNDDYLLSGIPNELKKATAEYSLIRLQLSRNLAPLPGVPYAITDPVTGETTVTGSGQLRRVTEKVGPIEDTKEYATGTNGRPVATTGNSTQNIPEYPQADLWIEKLTRSRTSRTVFRG